MEIMLKLGYFSLGTLPIIYELVEELKKRKTETKSSKKTTLIRSLLFSVGMIIILYYFYDAFFNV
ncbi:hypothetical protein AN960_23565 [Bacillus sp. FJAT-25509]|uniref:hypothetical protein n=1 Tax=Bacillaceae TaxID=186817 RepID=UPI0006FC3AB1|nr:hypothetical protein [Bacillus sp. FJAT-25509]KQL32943.1 hypothetical protein AN960_23565 [Bacillus sp. FJAT-25509]